MSTLLSGERFRDLIKLNKLDVCSIVSENNSSCRRRPEYVIMSTIREGETHLLGNEAGWVSAGREYLGFDTVISNAFHVPDVKSQTRLCSKPGLPTKAEKARKIGWKSCICQSRLVDT